jgi:uncharacterized membrane protein YfcA
VANEKTGNLADLAFELSVRTLSQQEKSLDELRSRTGVLLTATALVTSFLGARALQDPDLQWLSILGLAAAILSILLSIYVLAPKPNLNFALHGAAIYEYFIRAEADLEDAHLTLAYWNREAWNENQTAIDRSIVVFGIACGGLLVAVLLWSLKLPLD